MQPTDWLWDILLEIRKIISVHRSEIRLISILIEDSGFKIISNYITDKRFKKQLIFTTYVGIPQLHDTACYFINSNFEVNLEYNNTLNYEELKFMEVLLPVCFSSLKAVKIKRAVSVLHLAQSIDGKIATVSGNSKWISCDENLVFVHRLRALCDGILIGARTLNKDNPALTVRHVHGPNPVKVVIGNSAHNFKKISKSGEKIYHLVSKSGINHPSIDTICLEEQNHSISPFIILEELYKHGIYNVYIEGGANTASHFLHDGAVNIINVYISSKIFGSGISIELPLINEVEDSIVVKNSHFVKMGEGILLQGYIS